jgi:hypothetical protein
VDAGWTPFSVTVRLDGPGITQLLFQQGAAPATEVPTSHLWPQDPAAGLAATFAGANTVAHRVDTTVAAPWAGLVGARAGRPHPPYAGSRDFEGLPLGLLNGVRGPIRWEGEVYAEGGLYSLELRTDARARLFIDGALVVEQCREGPPAPLGGFRLNTGPQRPRVLTPGWHSVRLDYTPGADQGDAAPGGLEWLWTRPDGVREIVPPSRLRHPILPDGGIAWPAAPAPVTCLPRP